MTLYCNTCGHVMDRHRAAVGRKGSAPCNAPCKHGLCTCRKFVRIPLKKDKSKRKGEESNDDTK